jgi:hypothetical protein
MKTIIAVFFFLVNSLNAQISNACLDIEKMMYKLPDVYDEDCCNQLKRQFTCSVTDKKWFDCLKSIPLELAINGQTNYFLKDVPKHILDSLIGLSLYGNGLKYSDTVKIRNLKFFRTYFDPLKKLPAFVSNSDSLKICVVSFKKLYKSYPLKFPPNLEILTIYINSGKNFNLLKPAFTIKNLKRINLSFEAKKFEFDETFNDLAAFDNLNEMNISIDLGLKRNIKFISKFKNLNSLTVETFSGTDYKAIEQLSNVKKIRIRKITAKQLIQLKKFHKNVGYS